MATKKLLIVDQNSDFLETIPLKGTDFYTANLTGYSVEAGFQKFFTEGTYYTLTANIVGKSVTLKLSAADSANIEFGRYQYVVNMVHGANTARLQEGSLYMNPGVEPT